jgi:hypothetical protein
MFVSSRVRDVPCAFIAIALILPLATFGSALRAAASNGLRTVILSSPDLAFEPGGPNFPFLWPSLNNHGQATFTQLLPDSRLMSEAGGLGLQAVAEPHAVVVGALPGSTLIGFSQFPKSSDNGQTVFLARFSIDGACCEPDQVNDAIVVAGRGDELQLIAREGDQARPPHNSWTVC